MTNWFRGTMSTCRFELRRSFTTQRTAVSLVLALFPPVMLALMIGAVQVAGAAAPLSGELELARAAEILRSSTPFAIVFLVSLVTLLSLLLWATPNVYSELEGKSWAFVASRPGGRVSIYGGKFLAAVIVSFLIALIALTLCVLVANQHLSLPHPERLWLSLLAIFALACFVYGAVFSMLGALFFKRGMVVAAGYLIGSEVFLATVPAVVSKLTMRYHLQELGIHWIGFFVPFDSEYEYRALFGEAWPVWLLILVLIGAGIAALVIGGFAITNKEYITSEEN